MNTCVLVMVHLCVVDICKCNTTHTQILKASFIFNQQKTLTQKTLEFELWGIQKRHCQLILSNLPNLQWTANQSFKNSRHIIKIHKTKNHKLISCKSWLWWANIFYDMLIFYNFKLSLIRTSSHSSKQK